MCSKTELQKITSTMVQKYLQFFGNRVKQIILYGSYARGDFDVESDIDIAAIVDCTREEISAYQRQLAEVASDLDLEFGIMVSPSIIPYADYLKYKNDLPYYRNIATEGVELSACYYSRPSR